MSIFQTKKVLDDRLIATVSLLGNEQTSVRAAAIYLLYQQAMEHKRYREQIVQILCSHIRSKTQEPDYQEQYKTRPSNEIQTTIDLLFRTKENIGLYRRFGETRYFSEDRQFDQALPNANLSYAYCVGADFEQAACQGTNFWRASCQGARFVRSRCQEAEFNGTHCQGANFEHAYCEGASFWDADCQGGDFRRAYCQGVDFSEAHCEGANFGSAHCQGGDFGSAYCQGADFSAALCQGTHSSFCTRFRFSALADRIGKNTELRVLLEGALSQRSIDAIEKAKEYCSPDWYSRMQKIIEENKDKKEKTDIPDGIISGVLEDSEKLQKIIKELKESERRR